MGLDLTSLEEAIDRLEEAIAVRSLELPEDNPVPGRLIEAGIIQTFEFTYDLSVKMIRRHLALASANPQELYQMSFNNLLRAAYRRSLVESELVAWDRFRRLRSAASNTYDRNKAQALLEELPAFCQEARHLLKQLQERNDHLD